MALMFIEIDTSVLSKEEQILVAHVNASSKHQKNKKILLLSARKQTSLNAVAILIYFTASIPQHLSRHSTSAPTALRQQGPLYTHLHLLRRPRFATLRVSAFLIESDKKYSRMFQGRHSSLASARYTSCLSCQYSCSFAQLRSVCANCKSGPSQSRQRLWIQKLSMFGEQSSTRET